MPKRRRREAGDWVTAIEQHGRRYRFRVVVGGEGKIHSFDSPEEAERHRAAALRAVNQVLQERHTLTWREAIKTFMEAQKEEGRAQERSLAVVEGRLQRFFAPLLDAPALELGEKQARDLYRQLRERKGARGTVCSVQDHHHCLSRARALGAWLVRRKMWRSNTALVEVKPVGVPLAGEESKAQLSRDDLWKFWLAALRLGEGGDAGGAAASCCSILGMRATSVVDRERRHLDAQGTVLVVRAKRKTVSLSLVGKNEEQELVMARLRAVLALQARGKTPAAPLIGTGHDRWWVYRQVHRVCELAGVPPVPPHGLRGSHASAGQELGISPALLAGALAHSQEVQARHYATPAAQAAGQIARVVGQLGSPMAPQKGNSRS